MGDPNINPQILGFLSNKEPNKVPLISDAPICSHGSEQLAFLVEGHLAKRPSPTAVDCLKRPTMAKAHLFITV